MTSVESDPRSLRDHPKAWHWIRFSIMHAVWNKMCLAYRSLIHQGHESMKHTLHDLWFKGNDRHLYMIAEEQTWKGHTNKENGLNTHTQEGKYKVCHWRNCTRLCFHLWLAQDSASDLLTHEVQLWPQLFPQMLAGFLYPFSLSAPAQKKGLMQVHQRRKLTRPRPLTEN